MASVDDSLENITDAIDPEANRTPSQISDCYSNDNDYEPCAGFHPLSFDKDRLSLLYKRKLDLTHSFSDDLSDNLNNGCSVNDATNCVQSNIETSLCNRYYKSNLFHFILNNKTSSEIQKLNKKYSAGNILRMNHDDVSSCDNCDSMTLSGTSFPQQIDTYERRQKKFELCDTLVSNSLFDCSGNTTLARVNTEHKNTEKSSKIYSCIVPLEQALNLPSSNNIEKSVLNFQEVKNISNTKKSTQIKNVVFCSCNPRDFNDQSTQTLVENKKEQVLDYNGKISSRSDLSYLKLTKQLHESSSNELKDVLRMSCGKANVNMDTTLGLLKEQVTGIIAHIDNISHRSHSLQYQQNNPKKRKFVYTDDSIMNFYVRLKHLYSHLDSKINSTLITANISKQQKGCREDVENTVCINESGDVSSELNTERCTPISNFEGDQKQVDDCAFSFLSVEKEEACRVFELSPYDVLVRSYQSVNDRRIKAVRNRMKCQIFITGPICVYDSTNACWNIRNKTAYQCSITGDTIQSVNKCLKCLQETFPESCLNERRTIGKVDNKISVY